MEKYPRNFLCEFLLAGALLLLGWTYVSDMYFASIMEGVNLGLWFTDTSIYLRSGQPFAAGVACPDVIAAAALFMASSGRSWSWRIGGVVVVVLMLWLLQVVLMLLELHLAIYQVGMVEVVSVIRSWAGPPLALLLWASSSSMFAKTEKAEKNATGPVGQRHHGLRGLPVVYR